jgi:hypothetical protein
MYERGVVSLSETMGHLLFLATDLAISDQTPQVVIILVYLDYSGFKDIPRKVVVRLLNL